MPFALRFLRNHRALFRQICRNPVMTTAALNAPAPSHHRHIEDNSDPFRKEHKAARLQNKSTKQGN